jgi:hypothetical protein
MGLELTLYISPLNQGPVRDLGNITVMYRSNGPINLIGLNNCLSGVALRADVIEHEPFSY